MRFRRFSAFPISAFCLAPKIVQKKVKKKLTGDTIPAKLSPHTVTTTQNTTLQMKIKTLAIAAATLAVGAITSQAQVYSQNIVGYVNYISGTTSPQYEAICNPLDNGSNTLKSVFATPPGGSAITFWTGSGFGLIATYAGGHWKTNSVNADNYVIPPGKGFFVQWSAPYTNTFAGQVNPATGVTNVATIGSGYQLVTSLLPITDAVTNAATVNLTGIAGGTTLTFWNPSTQKFDRIFTYTGGHWKLGGVNTTPTNTICNSFFIDSGSSYNWQQIGF